MSRAAPGLSQRIGAGRLSGDIFVAKVAKTFGSLSPQLPKLLASFATVSRRRPAADTGKLDRPTAHDMAIRLRSCIAGKASSRIRIS